MIGHNGQIRQLVERIERLEEEKKSLSADIKEVYAEAKAAGFNTKVLRKAVALRKQDPGKVQEEAETLDVYMSALGMLQDAIQRA